MTAYAALILVPLGRTWPATTQRSSLSSDSRGAGRSRNRTPAYMIPLSGGRTAVGIYVVVEIGLVP